MSMEKTYAYEVEKIFTSWYSSLCYFAFRYVQDDETARDIVQEVFVRLMEKRQAFQSEQHLKNFLYLTIKKRLSEPFTQPSLAGTLPELSETGRRTGRIRMPDDRNGNFQPAEKSNRKITPGMP